MILGFFLRTYYLNKNEIVFVYDQARDAYIASQIAQGDLKILGPPVSLGGFYHGVFYYYFIALPYYLSQGNPILPIIFISLLTIAVIPLVYFIGKILFNPKIGLLAALFYTISFDIIQYSNWLSNPSLAIPFSVLLYFGLTLFFFTPKKTLGVILSAIGYALSFQSQFFLGYFLIPIVFCFFYLKSKITKKQLSLFIIITGLILSTMVLAYFKFGFTFIDGIKTMVSNADAPFSWQDIDFSIDFKMVLIRLVENFYRVVFPFNSFYTSIFLICCFVFFIKQIKIKSKLAKPLSLFWVFILSQAIVVPFGGESTPYINVGLQLPAILISAVFLIELSRTKKVLSTILIIVFCFFSLKTDIQQNPKGQLIFAIQKEMTLKNEIAVAQYTYQESNGQPFSINTVTAPYWVNTVWSYIYQWYGQNKYGYTPSFHGRDQSGLLSYLSTDPTEAKYFFLIIEPSAGIPGYLINDSIQYENSFSKIIKTKDIGGILVQKRELIKPINKINFVK